MPETTGPVQILAVGFREGARLEGRIAEQIDLLQESATIRVLDFVFLHRDEATGALVRMDYDGPDRNGRVTILLEDSPTNAGSEPVVEGPADAFRVSAEDNPRSGRRARSGRIRRIHHLRARWARGLKQAMTESGGVPFAEGFLTPEAVAAIGG